MIIPPAEFICPLTKELMSEPMVTRYGTRFERNAILKWLLDHGNAICPVTGRPLRVSDLLSDKNLEWKIQCWIKKNISDNDNDKDSRYLSESNDGMIVVTATSQDTKQHNDILSRRHDAIADDDHHSRRFVCPLSNNIMKEPMMSRHGHNFEKYAILSEIQSNGFVCPISGKPLRPSDLVPNNKLKLEIQHYQQQQEEEEQEEKQQQQREPQHGPISYEEVRDANPTGWQKSLIGLNLLLQGKLANTQRSPATDIIHALVGAITGNNDDGDDDDDEVSQPSLSQEENEHLASRQRMLSCIDDVIGTIIECDTLHGEIN